MKQARYNVIDKGYHYSELVTGKPIFNMNKQGLEDDKPGASVEKLTEKEIEFLKYACTEMTL